MPPRRCSRYVGHGQPLDVARSRDRDDHVLLGDQVLELEVLLGGDDLGPAIVVAAVDALELEQLLANQRVDAGLVRQDRSQLGDLLLQICELALDLLALERGESRQPQVQNRLRLRLRELERRHQAVASLLDVLRRADERDDRVEVVERDEVALEDVRPVLGPAQLVLRAARDDLALVVEVVADELEQRERPWDALDESDRVVAERRLERRVLEELVEHHLRDSVALELDLDPHPGLVGVVVDVRDLGQHLVVDEVGDLLDDAGVPALLHAVRELRDDDRRLAAAQLLDVRASAHDDAAAAGAVRVADPAAADDDGARREVGALDDLREPLDVDRRVVDHRHDPVDDLAEVVRREVRRHPDGDPGRAVDEQVGEARRQHRRLPARLVVVRLEVDRVGVDVTQQLGRHAGQTALCVSHGGCRVVVDVPEVALAVDERVAKREGLREADERVVDRLVAVRVVGAHHVADHARTLESRSVRLQAGLVHRVENAPMHGLQAVADVRQGARDDHAHRVVEEARAHLLLELARLDAAGPQRAGVDLRHRPRLRAG